MTQISRRAFLIGGGGLLLLSNSFANTTKHEIIVGSRKTMDRRTSKLAFNLLAVDTRGARFSNIALDFHMHGFAPHPLNPARAVLFEKQGPGACEVDLISNTVLRRIPSAPDCWFYGHGTYGSGGQLLYATESKNDGTGIIAVRDGKSLQLLGQFPTYGAKPHDCQLIDEGKTLVITNGGGTQTDGLLPPSVAYVDINSEKLLERLTFDTPRINAGHLFVTRRRELIVISAPREGLPKTDTGKLSIRDGERLFTMSDPKNVTQRMLGETLSLSVHEASGVVIATNPDGNVVTLWNLKKKELIKSIDVEHPRGVTVTRDQKHFVLSCGLDPKLLYLSTATLKIDVSRTVENAGFTSSHIYNHLL